MPTPQNIKPRTENGAAAISPYFTFIFWVLFAAFFLSLSACRSKNPQAPLFSYEASDLPSDPAVEYGTLENGLRYAVRSNNLPSNTASLYMRFGVGSLEEAEEERGLAHFLEHMAFNGSKNIPEGELIPRLEKHGLAFGPDTNASTSFDETIYMLELPDVGEEIIDEALFIMRETAENLLLEPEAIEKERGVILAEKRARKSPAYDAGIDGLNWFLKGSLYPERLPIGTTETVETVTPEQFRSFYEKYYRPDNSFIVLVGDLETDFSARKIADYFADWQNVTTRGEKVEPSVLAPRQSEANYYTDPEIETKVSITTNRAPDLRKDMAATRKARFIEGLGNRILSRRFSALAQDPNASFMGAGAGSFTYFDIIGMSSLNISCQPENWQKALSLGERELRRAYLFGFTQSELDEQIANTRKSLEVGVQSAQTRRTRSLARGVLGAFSSESVITTPQSALERFEAYSHTITPHEVHEAFKALWKGYEAPLLYLSTSEILDDGPERLQAVYKESQKVAVEKNLASEIGTFAYRDFGPPGKIAARNHIEDIDFEQIRFDNNVLLNIKKTPYEKNEINISIAYNRGKLDVPEDRLGLNYFLPTGMSLGGLKAHSADDIRTLMAGKAVGVSFSFGSEQLFMSGSTTPDNLRDQMNLMMAYMRVPGFRPEAKSRYEKNINSFYPTLDSTPGGVASRDIPRLIRSGNVRFGVPPQSVLTQVTMDDLQQWLRPSQDDSLIEIGIVGDVDIDVIIEEVARTFGTLPKRKSAMPDPDPKLTALTFPPGNRRPVTLTHAGDADTALLQIYWPSFDGQDVDMVRRISVLKSIFDLRLTDVVREELGASYSPSAFYSAPRLYPDYGYIGASLEVSPDMIDKAEARIHALVKELAAGTMDEDLLARALRPIQENIEENLESNNYWMGVTGRSQGDPEKLARHRSRAESYETMTLDDIRPIAKQVFVPGTAVSFHILPDAAK